MPQMVARAIKNEIRALTGGERERGEPRASDACAAALFSDEEELPQASACGCSADGTAVDPALDSDGPSSALAARHQSAAESPARLRAGRAAAPEPGGGWLPGGPLGGPAGEGTHATLTHAALAGEHAGEQHHSDAHFAGQPLERPAEVSDCGGSLMSVDGDATGSPGARPGSPPHVQGSDSSMLSRSGSAYGGEGEAGDGRAAAAAAVCDDGGGGGVLGQKRPACGLLSPPKEEDRKLPMKKLFENLHELAVEAGAGGAPGQPPAAFPPPPEGALPAPHPVPAPPRSASRPSLAALFAPERPSAPPHSPHPLRRATAEAGVPPRANGLSGKLSGAALPQRAASLDDELRMASAPASKAGSRDGSPLGAEVVSLSALPAGLVAGSPGGLACAGVRSESGLASGLGPRNDSGGFLRGDLGGPPLARPRSRADLPEVHEARRRQAATSLGRLEHQCLNGLDMTSITRGCRKAPSKGLPLGAARPQQG